MRDDLRRMAMFGSGVAELTKNRAEQLAKDLLEKSKQNRSELLRVIRDEIENQLASLGVAKKRDVERLERRVARLEATVREQAAASKAPAPSKSTAKKSTAKKTSASKTTASKTTAKKTTSASTTSSGS